MTSIISAVSLPVTLPAVLSKDDVGTVDQGLDEAVVNRLTGIVAKVTASTGVMQGPALRDPAAAPDSHALAKGMEELGRLGQHVLDELSLDRHLGTIDEALRTGQPETSRTPPGIDELLRTDAQFAMMVLLMQLMMVLGRMSREEGLSANEMQLALSKAAGAKGVDARQKELMGQLGGLFAGVAFGLGGFSQTYKGNQVTTRSYGKNTGGGNARSGQVSGDRNAGAAATTPHTKLRPEHAVTFRDGKKAAVPADRDTATEAQEAVLKSNVNKADISKVNTKHGEAMAASQNYFARAALLQMVANAMQALVSSGFNVAAAADEAEKMLLEALSSVAGKMSDTQREESMKHRQQAEAALQTLQNLNSTDAAMADHWTSKLG